MQPLLTAAQMRQAEETAIHDVGLPELVLMEHAALAVARALRERFGALLPETRGIVLAGAGNNGGDAIAAARILAEEGVSKIVVVSFGDGESRPSAALQRRILGRAGVPWVKDLDEDLLASADWLIDGLFGIGLARPLDAETVALVDKINRHGGRKWIVAVDIPSGLSADTGVPQPTAIAASETVTFGYVKRGLVTGQAADFVGKLRFDPVQIPRSALPISPDAFLYDVADASRLPERRPAGHKGDYGHVVVVAGPEEKQGAALLSARGVLRAGAGLVTVAGAPATLETLRARAPAEVMTATLTPDLFSSRSRQCAVVGPGLGVKTGAPLLKSALASDWDLVLDADALTLLAENTVAVHRPEGAVTVLTPHPKEASRLLQCSVADVENDRFAACRALVEKFGTYVVLKGKGTLIGGPDLPTIVVTAGNTALSKGGTGDILAGIVASLLAQKLGPVRALPLAVFIHGRAAELLVQRTGSERSALATEIADELPHVFSELSAWKPS